MYFLRNLNTVDPINLHANVFILGINKNTTKYAVYGCLQTVIYGLDIAVDTAYIGRD